MESFLASRNGDWAVYGLPAFTDNYIWAIAHHGSKACWVVDPGCAETVRKFAAAHALHVKGFLITHHHPDHIGGLTDLLKNCEPATPVYGPASGRIAQVNRPVSDAAKFEAMGLAITAYEVPGHTLDHVAFAVRWPTEEVAPWLFCGDTLFSAGCGRLFEGTAQQMHESLQKLNGLPGNTLVFCAHEYTESNLRFALSIATDQPVIEKRMREVQEIRSAGHSTIPTTLNEERNSNLFLKAGNANELAVLRKAKDNF